MKKLLFFASAVALLASCSQDLTGDVAAPSVTGKTKIIAHTDSSNDATRTHFEETVKEDGTSSFKYEWDNGDAIGLFAATEDDDTNAYFGYDGTGEQFSGDYDMVKGTEYYAYYPWDRAAALDGTKLTLYINAKQKYNHNNGNSFAATEAPAVAVGSAPAEGETMELKFKNLGTYVRVPIIGFGKVETITLAFGTTNDTTVATNASEVVAGSFTVNMEDVKKEGYPEYKMEEQGAKYITLVSGNKSVPLSLETPEYFWFVVPAGIVVPKDGYANIWVNVDAAEIETTAPTFSYQFTNGYTTKSNTPVLLGDKSNTTAGQNYAYFYGDEIAISTPADLLWYLYFVNHGVETGFEKEHVSFFNVTAGGSSSDDTYELKHAILTKDIAFYDAAGNAAEGVPTRMWEDQYQELTAAQKALYDWYVHPTEDKEDANYYINTIGETSEIDEKKPLGYTAGAVSDWSIEGYGENGVTVSGLTVKGNGVFATEGASNITLKNFTVDASEVEDDKVHFLYSDLIAGVTVGEGCQLVVAEDGKGALIDAVSVKSVKANPDGLPKVAALPTYAGTETKIAYAYTLNIDEDVVWADYKDLNFVEKEITESGVVVTVADAEEAEEFFATEINTENADYYSVVDETTSYWTGTVADKFAEANKIATAEELAYATSLTTERKTSYTLVANIDLRKETWLLSHSTTKFTIDGANGEDCYTISNVVIDGTCASNHDTPTIDASAGHALFGLHADVKNLVVNGIKITVTKANEKTKVAALAGDGDAENVTVKGLTINTEKAAAVAYVGGLFAEYTADAIVKDCKVESATIEGSAAYGDLAGKFTITAKDEENDVEFTATVVGAKKLFGKVLVDVTYTQSTYTTLAFTDYSKDVVPAKTDISYNYPSTDNSRIIHKFTETLDGENVFEPMYVEPAKEK